MCDCARSDEKLTASYPLDIGQKVPAPVHVVLLVIHFLRSTAYTDVD